MEGQGGGTRVLVLPREKKGGLPRTGKNGQTTESTEADEEPIKGTREAKQGRRKRSD